ncbi:MAG: T9SS C-terminal target domain-containing protein, partial [Bacteroidetes bacterium]
TDPNAHNYDPIANQDDGSCETCTDGVLNGDETDVDCGGALCAPCGGGGCTYVVIDFNNFNSSWGIWNDGGSDCRRSANDAPYAVGGTGRPVRLRDNTSTSTMTTDNLNLTAYEELTVDFSYYPRSMDNSNEDFWLQISTNGGASYTTVEEWNLNDEFVNDQRYYDAVVIPGPFTSNTRLRFRCDASGNSDWIYIDDVEISGCTTGATNLSGPGAGTPEDVKPVDAIEEPMVDLNLFPNPTRDQLTVSFQLTQDATVQLMVTDLNGKVVSQQQLNALKGNVKTTIDASNFGSGVYMVHLLTDTGRLNGKFIVVD